LLAVIRIFEVDVANLLRHAPLADHGGGHLCDFAEVVGRARGHRVEVEFLGDAAAERHGHAVHELVDVHEVCVTIGQVLGVAESPLPAGDDGDLKEWVGVLEVPAADSVAGFVVRDSLLFLGLEDKGLLLETTDDALDGLLEVNHGDCLS
jgi:hypothetical protein